MKGNKLIYLVIVLVVAVAAIIIGDRLGKKTPSEKELQFFPEIKEDAIGSITITKGFQKLELRKKGDVWVVVQPSAMKSKKEDKVQEGLPLGGEPVGGDSSAMETETAETHEKEYPVDSASITTALEKVVTLKKNVLISENPEKQTKFEVDSVKGTFVDIADNSGKAVGSFIVGKSGPDYTSNYVRKMGSNSVYMAPGNVRNAFYTDLKRWRNKSILKFDKTTAKGITLAAKDSAVITLAKADTGNPWQILDPIKNPAKTEEVDAILNKLSVLNASDFQDEVLEDTAMGFDSPHLAVTVSFVNGSSRSVIFGKKNKDNKYWVKTDSREQIFLIGEYYVNQINKKLDDLKGEPLVTSIDPDSLSK
jgi:hypothetical protein